MTQAQLNPSAKSRFQESVENVKAHHELIQSAVFQRAEDAALLQYSRAVAAEVANATDPQSSQVRAMQAGLKLVAVQEFISEFRNLAEKPVVAQAPGLARVLDHKN